MRPIHTAERSEVEPASSSKFSNGAVAPEFWATAPFENLLGEAGATTAWKILIFRAKTKISRVTARETTRRSQVSRPSKTAETCTISTKTLPSETPDRSLIF